MGHGILNINIWFLYLCHCVISFLTFQTRLCCVPMPSEKDRCDDNTYYNKVRIAKYNKQSIIIHINQ